MTKGCIPGETLAYIKAEAEVTHAACTWGMHVRPAPISCPNRERVLELSSTLRWFGCNRMSDSCFSLEVNNNENVP